MDLEPMWCSEQIKVPENLADILKAYTKEVIRRQPADILEFSAAYFAHLAKVAEDAEDFVPPSKEEITQAFAYLGQSEGMVDSEKVTQSCLDAGIARSTVNSVFKLGGFGRDGKLPAPAFFVLLLTMTTHNFAAVVSGLFDVFGEAGALPTPQFLRLFDILSEWDASLSEALRTKVAASVEGITTLTYAKLLENSALRDRLAVL